MFVRMSIATWSMVLALAAIAFGQQVQPAQPRSAPREQPRVLPRDPADQPAQAQPNRGVAQPRALQDRTAPPQGSQQHGQVNQGDVAKWLILGNHAEIELGKLAQQKSKNQQVREFAAMMIKDHTEYTAKLQKFAGPSGQEDRAQPSTGDRAEAPQRVARGGQTWMDLGRRASQLKLDMTKQLLSKYDGQDFDMGYLGQQIGAHVEMLACLHAAKNVGDENFQQVIEEGIKTTQEHLQHAQELANRLEDKEGADTQRGTPQGASPRTGGTVRPEIRGPSDRSAQPRREGDTITPDNRPRSEVPQREVP